MSIAIAVRALRRTLAGVSVGIIVTAAPAAPLAATPEVLSPEEARTISREAYTYGFPLVDNYRILYSYFENRTDPEYKAPWNSIRNVGRVYTPEDTAIQTPNSDTPYSFLGADLRTEPLVLTLPAVSDGRYISAQFIDLNTYNFAYAGTRATGNRGGRFLLAGPGWKGDTPPGIDKVFRSETELALVIYRTQLYNPADLDQVKRVQAGYTVQTLSQYLGKPAPVPAPPIAFRVPLDAKQERSSLEFFEALNFVLKFCHPHPSEQAMLARFARLGIGAGLTFDAAQLSPQLRKAVEQGIADAWQSTAEVHRQLAAGKLKIAALVGSREHLKDHYAYRMTAAAGGIYGNSAEEAFYHVYYTDVSGQRVDTGKSRYRLRFAPGQLPPVHAFWSITPYALPSQSLVVNPLSRYLINSAMMDTLKRDADGGLTVYIQHESPGKDKESNWLPGPDGTFKLALRLYLPKEEVLSGAWKPPALQAW